MGFVYVAFVIDAYSRRILGWRAARSMTTDLVLDAIEHAFFTRAQDGTTNLRGLIAHSDAGAQYTSVAFTQRLIDEGVDPSVGSVSPAMIRMSVVLPAPLAPTSATVAPSPTRNDTWLNKVRPSGRTNATPLTSTWPTRSQSHLPTREMATRFAQARGGIGPARPDPLSRLAGPGHSRR